MSIFVCGDIHSTLDIDKLDRFKKRKDLNKNDYLIICGDTGICGPSKKNAIATREYLRNLPMTVLFVDGNHEDFGVLNRYPVEEWHGGKVHIIEPGIIHLMRGQVYLLDGKRFFVFGGAYSIDRSWGVLGETWFEEELPSKEEYEEAWENLKNHGYAVDYIITHTGPYEVVAKLDCEPCDETLEQVRFFQKIADEIAFQDWYFGHFHKDKDIGKFHCRMDKVTQVK